MWWEVGEAVCTYVPTYVHTYMWWGKGGCVYHSTYVCVYLCGGMRAYMCWEVGDVSNQKTVLCGCHRWCMSVCVFMVYCVMLITL